MRMWKVDPELLCDTHLLGEHVEMHMFSGSLDLGKSIDGYINGGLVEPRLIKSRHDELAEEMLRRGMNHRSPLTVSDYVDSLPRGNVNVDRSMFDLSMRCSRCKERISAHLRSKPISSILGS